ncbi:uncharacterized protein CIMG_12937 [Coccidioides immitis RS]|uniref:Uncharacterized protein n=1 Tax=Coccidioides immitis (strain RS) TaxID=246410 RepID=A0A0D8JTV9_COCIM|nr:uncharacterized protein CIMG_12937 [Coccidioides immitis RS]KJF60401.1 hypothetical protein CIMG_12937 [Coccidioides immitis RS]
MHFQWFALNHIDIYGRQNSSEENHKTKTSQLQHSIAAYHGYNYLAAVDVSRERVEKEMRGFLSQLQNLIEDNNSLSATEKMKKDDFEIVMFSDENNKKNDEKNDD